MTAPADETENEENLDAAAPENAEGGQGGGESGGDEEDDLAAEWGAALGEGEENAAAGGEDGGEGGQTRVLNPCLSGYHPHPLYVVCLLGLQARAGAGALRRRSG